MQGWVSCLITERQGLKTHCHHVLIAQMHIFRGLIKNENIETTARTGGRAAVKPVGNLRV